MPVAALIFLPQLRPARPAGAPWWPNQSVRQLLLARSPEELEPLARELGLMRCERHGKARRRQFKLGCADCANAVRPTPLSPHALPSSPAWLWTDPWL